MQKSFTTAFETLVYLDGRVPGTIATEMGVPRNTFSRWLNGETQPSMDDLEKVSVFFDADIRMFFDHTGKRSLASFAPLRRDLT